MSFRLWIIFYLFALLAAAMATFGPAGILITLGILGFWMYVWKRDHQAVHSRTWFTAVNILVSVLAFLVIAPFTSVRGTARRISCMDNLKEIQLGILNYEAANGIFPPAAVTDSKGKPLHSWRILILPYTNITNSVALYKQYNFNEPWDGPNNRKLAQQSPYIYRCPSHDHGPVRRPGETHYFAVVGPETAWPNNRVRTVPELTDGLSRSIMVIEAAGLGVNWLQPQDLSVEQAVELLTTKQHSGHAAADEGFFTTTHYDRSYRNVAYADGHIEWMGQLKDAGVAKALLTVAGGEPWPFEPFEWEDKFVEAGTRTTINWGNVWGLSIFVFLYLLPGWLLYRNVAQTQTTEAPVEDKGDVKELTLSAMPGAT
jgi:prepilin-type processing-associated H-X9-DG protein